PPSFQDAVRTLNTLQTNASYLEQVKRERGDPRAQLEAMKGFLARSGLQVEDLDRLNIIHVTGTKGKGSDCAFTGRAGRHEGTPGDKPDPVRALPSSPHLVQVRERIRINGQPISKEQFSKYFWLVYNRLEETKDPARASMPAYFRFLTVMAFHVFLQEKVDLAVVEVGIGGAYDCTNIIRPALLPPQPCQFDYAVFCPNFAEVSVMGNADQQNFNVTLENALTRCLENQKTWTQLLEEKVGQELWLASPLEVGSVLKPEPVRGALLLVPSAERPLNSNSLVFPCISHALQWIAQGRDPCVPAPATKGAHPHPVASSGAVLLREAAVIRVLVTGSLHLVGGVLKLLDPALSQ
ncbi:PREDICTED: folylpolyglutamate synthase, mitochondrial, partial [Tinamus guttatus]|uniref:folylpolyglutamate synthase, mitochondrial n=1 Tax=Tinamus guttatus TaxID=94827 RepID=UPI00052F0B5A